MNKKQVSKEEQLANDFDIESNCFHCDVSYRGGTIKIDVSSIFPYLEEEATMGAYQNYLGGGIAGSIVGASMFDPSSLTEEHQKVFEFLKERIKKYFHALNHGGGDEYMQENYGSYEQNQGMPKSAY